MQATLAAVLGGRIVLESLSAGQLCDDVKALFAERLANKGIALTVTGPRSAHVRCNIALLRDSVLANLFSNALKFSPAGGAIELWVAQDADAVAIEVADHGPGLPEDVRMAFERGVRAPSHAGTAGEAGSGYGLMLARDYLEEMGGSLQLQSREGGGLVARIVLPRAEVKAA
jgi:signal transduction histidine kinase